MADVDAAKSRGRDSRRYVRRRRGTSDRQPVRARGNSASRKRICSCCNSRLLNHIHLKKDCSRTMIAANDAAAEIPDCCCNEEMPVEAFLVDDMSFSPRRSDAKARAAAAGFRATKPAAAAPAPPLRWPTGLRQHGAVPASLRPGSALSEMSWANVELPAAAPEESEDAESWVECDCELLEQDEVDEEDFVEVPAPAGVADALEADCISLRSEALSAVLVEDLCSAVEALGSHERHSDNADGFSDQGSEDGGDDDDNIYDEEAALYVRPQRPTLVLGDFVI